MAKIDKPILAIRDVLRKVKIDPESDKMPRQVLKRFVHCAEEVDDPRHSSLITYPLSYILLLSFLAVFSGADNWAEISTFAECKRKLLKRMLPSYLGAPSHDTFRRVLGLIDPEQLSEAVTAFLLENLNHIKKALRIPEEGNRLIAIDGKEARRTGRKYETDEKVRNLQTLHVYDVSNAVCLKSVPIAEKTNEIPTAQAILSQMQLKNCVVTFDALNTQKETIRIICQQGGVYVGGLKGNQQTFFEEVGLCFTEKERERIRKKKTHFRTITEKAHNRIEKREYYMVTDISWFADLHLWAGLKAFICSELTTEDLVTRETTHETHYYISASTDLELCADAIRSHWSIENQLHWHLDVTFAEDDNATMDKNAFSNLSILNKIALSLYKLLQPSMKIGLKGIRKSCSWDIDGRLAHLLSLFDEDILSEAMLRSAVKK